MKVRDLLAALSSVDPDAEVLINREWDDESDSKMNFKLTEVLPAFANHHELEHQNFDITHYVNDGVDARPVVVLSDEPIKQLERKTHFWNGSFGQSTYSPVSSDA